MKESTAHKQVIVLRKDLNMRKGKMVAQGAHASMAAILKLAIREGNRLMIPLDERIEPPNSAVYPPTPRSPLGPTTRARWTPLRAGCHYCSR